MCDHGYPKTYMKITNCQLNWFDKHPWLQYRQPKDDAYCL